MRNANITSLVCLAVVALTPTPAMATQITATGTIKSIVTHDTSVAGRNYLTLNGFISGGSTTCGVNGGYVLAKIKMDDYGKAQYSMALASFLAGKQVEIILDDTVKDGSFCYLRLLKIL